jgi:hypothetical protein
MSAFSKRDQAHAVHGGSVATTSAILVERWDSRIELQITNSDDANGVWLAFQSDPTTDPVAAATAASPAFYLAPGATFKTNAYTGSVAALAVTAAVVVSVVEF